MLFPLTECKTALDLISSREKFLFSFIATLENISAQMMLKYWGSTQISLQDQYKEEIIFLIANNIIPAKRSDGKFFSIGALKHIHFQNIEYIKNIPDLSETHKKRLLDCYLAFCEWLQQISFCWFRARGVNKENFEPTHFEIWRMFIETLYTINTRDELIARALLQGQQRVSIILGLKLDQINFKENRITFLSKGKSATVNYHQSFMDDLKEYVTATQHVRKEPFVFITRTGQPVTRARLNYSFEQVGHLLPGIKDKLTPDTLRHLWQQLQRDGYDEGIIMRSKQTRVNEDMKLEKEFLNNLEVSL